MEGVRQAREHLCSAASTENAIKGDEVDGDVMKDLYYSGLDSFRSLSISKLGNLAQSPPRAANSLRTADRTSLAPIPPVVPEKSTCFPSPRREDPTPCAVTPPEMSEPRVTPTDFGEVREASSGIEDVTKVAGGRMASQREQTESSSSSPLSSAPPYGASPPTCRGGSSKAAPSIRLPESSGGEAGQTQGPLCAPLTDPPPPYSKLKEVLAHSGCRLAPPCGSGENGKGAGNRQLRHERHYVVKEKIVPRVVWVEKKVEVPVTVVVDRLVSHPVTRETVKEVPKFEVKEVTQFVKKPETRIKHRIEYQPRVEYVDEYVRVPQIQEVVKEVPKVEVRNIPVPRIIQMPKIETQEVPHVKNVPRNIFVERPVDNVILQQTEHIRTIERVKKVQVAKEFEVERLIEVPEPVYEDIPMPYVEERPVAHGVEFYDPLASPASSDDVNLTT